MKTQVYKIEQSVSVAFADYVRVKEREGRQIVKMQTGDPDFPTHPKIVKTAHEAMISGETKYCDSRGLLSLRESLSLKLFTQNGIRASAAENILITQGAVHGIAIAVEVLVSPGDEVIILEPFWRAYEANVILAGGVPVIVQCAPDEKFQLNSNRVLAHFTAKTKAIIINTPNNPSGAVFNPAELIKLTKGAAARGVYIISDEVYETLIFSDARHHSIAADPEVFEFTISAFSFSKSHAMTGWRIGYIVANKLLIDQCLKLSQFSITSLPPFSQLAALTALNEPEAQAYSEYMRSQYELRKRHIEVRIKNTWLYDSMLMPEGTFYTLINVTRFGMSSLELAKKIVEIGGVSFTPGKAFGDRMDAYLRMCFATSIENIDTALDVLIQLDREDYENRNHS
jgi:aspartate/methionine/tyrosine aminotransferase